jgi:hypothetical protein
VLPAITEVKDKAEAVARRHGVGDLDRGLLLDRLVALEGIGVNEADPPAVGKLELVQMRQIPAREGRVDRVGQPQERVRRPDDEDPPRRRRELAAETAHQVNPNLKPRARHRLRTLRDRF